MYNIWDRAEKYSQELDKANKQLEQVESIVREMFFEIDDLQDQGEDEKSKLLEKYRLKLNKAIGNS